LRHQNGEGPDHRGGGVEAREPEQLGRRLKILDTAETSTGQDRVIRAELVGSDQCMVAGYTVQAAAPALGMCRKLAEAGVDLDTPLHAYRCGTLALSIRSIGEGARLTVKERPFGPVFESWKPFPTPPVSPPTRTVRPPQGRRRAAR
jgi:hypothetical protein